MDYKNELLFKVVERYLFHSTYASKDPMLQSIANSMVDIELYEMWLLTQE